MIFKINSKFIEKFKNANIDKLYNFKVQRRCSRFHGARCKNCPTDAYIVYEENICPEGTCPGYSEGFSLIKYDKFEEHKKRLLSV